MSPNACGCPTINPADWEGKLFNWEGKAFFYKHVKYLFSVPLNVERKMAEAAQMIEQRGYILEEPLMILAREGRFKGTIFVAILPTEGEDKSVINVPPCALAATVYQRKEAKIGPGVKAFKRRLEAEKKRVKDIYLWHVSCPMCAAKHGYKTIIFAELALDSVAV